MKNIRNHFFMLFLSIFINLFLFFLKTFCFFFDFFLFFLAYCLLLAYTFLFKIFNKIYLGKET